MWHWFLIHYVDKNPLFSFKVFYWDRYNLEGNRRAKVKIHSIAHWLKLYNSKHFPEKKFYWAEARECFEQLQEALKKSEIHEIPKTDTTAL